MKIWPSECPCVRPASCLSSLGPPMGPAGWSVAAWQTVAAVRLIRRAGLPPPGLASAPRSLQTAPPQHRRSFPGKKGAQERTGTFHTGPPETPRLAAPSSVAVVLSFPGSRLLSVQKRAEPFALRQRRKFWNAWWPCRVQTCSEFGEAAGSTGCAINTSAEWEAALQSQRREWQQTQEAPL